MHPAKAVGCVWPGHGAIARLEAAIREDAEKALETHRIYHAKIDHERNDQIVKLEQEIAAARLAGRLEQAEKMTAQAEIVLQEGLTVEPVECHCEGMRRLPGLVDEFIEERDSLRAEAGKK